VLHAALLRGGTTNQGGTSIFKEVLSVPLCSAAAPRKSENQEQAGSCSLYQW